MKKVLIFIIVSCFASTVIYAQSKSLIKDMSAEISFIGTPQVTTTNYPQTTSKLRWLKIEVEYKTLLSKLKGTRKKFNWIDDITVKFELLFPSVIEGEKTLAMMTGSVELWALPMDGEKHIIQGFIPPQIIQRYAQTGIKLKNTTAKTLSARITFYSKDNKPLGRVFAKPRKTTEKKIAKVFQRAAKRVKGAVKIDSVILGRNKTPWSIINSDTYDLIKADESK